MPDARRKKVLVIDDFKEVREGIEAMLANEEEKYETIPARNGREGLCLLQFHDGDIGAIILDCSMPVMGGREFLKELHSNPLYEPYRHIGVIGFSMYGRNIWAGYEDYLFRICSKGNLDLIDVVRSAFAEKDKN